MTKRAKEARPYEGVDGLRDWLRVAEVNMALDNDKCQQCKVVIATGGSREEKLSTLPKHKKECPIHHLHNAITEMKRSEAECAALTPHACDGIALMDYIVDKYNLDFLLRSALVEYRLKLAGGETGRSNTVPCESCGVSPESGVAMHNMDCPVWKLARLREAVRAVVSFKFKDSAQRYIPMEFVRLLATLSEALEKCHA